MGTRKNKTRLGEWEYTIQKPMANDVVMRNGLFVSIQNGYIVPATSQTVIEGCAINDRYSGENNEHRYCIYQPRRDRETFTMEVENGTLKQEDVGKTFRIIGVDQHINYSTKADFGGQFRLEEVLSDNLGTFTYNKEAQFAPQGPQGNDGETPTIEMGTVTKLQPDQNPTAELIPNGNTYTLNLGIPVGATGPRGQKGDTGEKGNTGTAGQPGQNGTDGTDGTNGTNGISPHYEGDWNGGQTYTNLAIVRYPDTNNEYWTWIREGETLSGATPGVDARRKKMNKDGEPGPQGEAGGTIVVPVEGKPGKDGIGVDGKNGDDGISPHDEGTWDSSLNYSELAMVRADTEETDQRGNSIRGYYVTPHGAGIGQNPATSSNRQLVAQDGIASKGNPYTVTVGLKSSLSIGGEFNELFNLPVRQLQRDCYTGNRDMISNNIGYITITKAGHYRVFGHLIVRANTGGANRYINLGRFSIALFTNRTGAPTQTFLATAKQGGPSAVAPDQGPWFDLTIDTQVDLYEGDTLVGYVRMQSDDPSVRDSVQEEGERGTYNIIGANDASGETSDGTSLGGTFASYIGVEMVSAHTWQEDEPDMLVSDL